MKIEILCNDGSPLGVTEKSIFGEDGRLGVGGAELALLTLCKGWHDAGHDVVLYNTPDIPDGSCFEQRPVDVFSPQDSRDILIIFRSPNSRINGANGKKIWWSCDQYTVGDFKAFAGLVDEIVTISPYHSEHFANMYGIYETVTIDLPVRMWEYPADIEKVPYKCIWNSIPDRGVEVLAQVWAKIVRQVPEASLVITSDWRLWSKGMSSRYLEPYKAMFAQLPNVHYTGAIHRAELIRYELESQINLATNTYEELFCIAIAECQFAGAYPVSSNSGAIRTTNMGKIFVGNPRDDEWQREYVEYVIGLLQDQKKLKRITRKLQVAAMKRFSLDTILDKWNRLVFE